MGIRANLSILLAAALLTGLIAVPGAAAVPATDGAGPTASDASHAATKKKRKKRKKKTRNAAAPGAQGCANADITPSTDVQAAEQASICLLNQERTSRGLGAVSANGELATAAERHAQDMVDRQYFAHDSLGGLNFVARILRTGYVGALGSWLLGENLAWGTGSQSTPRSVVNGWMNSPAHRVNVLKDGFQDIGVGIVLGAPTSGNAQNAATYASEYGRR